MVGLSRIQMAPFGIQPLFDHLNTRLVQYSDPHCIATYVQQFKRNAKLSNLFLSDEVHNFAARAYFKEGRF